jgi:hypothetical protein
MRVVITALSIVGFVASANAASLVNKPSRTAKAAARAGAAYALDKAAGYRAYGKEDIKVLSVRDVKGPNLKVRVQTKDGFKALTITVRKDSASKFRAYIPNLHTFTPPSTGNR